MGHAALTLAVVLIAGLLHGPVDVLGQTPSTRPHGDFLAGAAPGSVTSPGASGHASPWPSDPASPGASPLPSARPAPTPGPGGWFTSDVATGLFGVAGNGDIIAASPGPDGPEIRRLSPTGELIAAVPWSKKALETGASVLLIDPTDDSIVAIALAGRARIIHISTRTGRVIDSFRLRGDGVTVTWSMPAIDAEGRLYIVCQAWVQRRAFVPPRCPYGLRTGSVAVFDRKGRKTAGRFLYEPKGCTFSVPAQMVRVTDGSIRALSLGFDEGACRGRDTTAVDLTPNLRLDDRYEIPLDAGYSGHGFDSRVQDMAGAHDGTTYLIEQTRKGKAWQYDRFRLREIGPDGTVLRTWGNGGMAKGLLNPIAVELGVDGTIWVWDLDSEHKKSSLRWLPPPSRPESSPSPSPAP